MLLGVLSATLSGNLSAGKSTLTTGEGKTRAGQCF